MTIPVNPPAYGMFLRDIEVAEMLLQHMPALEQERQWCSNRRAEPRIVMAIANLRAAIDLLRAERKHGTYHQYAGDQVRE